MRELFNLSNAIAIVDLPANLETLATNLSLVSQLTVETLIQHYTLYRFYAAFLPQARSQQVLSQAQEAVKGSLAVGKTFRMMVSRVAKAIGQLTLIEQHLDEMPLTQAYLNSATESIEAY